MSFCNNNNTTQIPSITPTIYSMSVNTSTQKMYSCVYVNGSNFLPNGISFIQFGTIPLPVVFFSSFSLSFIVPLNMSSGNYPVTVVNKYNPNFINQSYPGTVSISNSINYTIN